MRHLLDELLQHRAVVKHKGVDGNAFTRDALCLFEGLLCSPLTDPPEAQGRRAKGSIFMIRKEICCSFTLRRKSEGNAFFDPYQFKIYRVPRNIGGSWKGGQRRDS